MLLKLALHFEALVKGNKIKALNKDSLLNRQDIMGRTILDLEVAADALYQENLQYVSVHTHLTERLLLPLLDTDLNAGGYKWKDHLSTMRSKIDTVETREPQNSAILWRSHIDQQI